MLMIFTLCFLKTSRIQVHLAGLIFKSDGQAGSFQLETEYVHKEGQNIRLCDDSDSSSLRRQEDTRSYDRASIGRPLRSMMSGVIVINLSLGVIKAETFSFPRR